MTILVSFRGTLIDGFVCYLQNLLFSIVVGLQQSCKLLQQAKNGYIYRYKYKYSIVVVVVVVFYFTSILVNKYLCA